MENILDISDSIKSELQIKITEGLNENNSLNNVLPPPDYTIPIDSDLLFPEKKERDTSKIIGRLKI